MDIYAKAGDFVHKISVHKLLEAMLVGAAIGGNESAQRYVACTVIASGQGASDPQQNLKNLADDWVVFLLKPCKSALSFRSAN
jgi:uncharacterized Ntn-hydrolase superfamily protein